jgi:glycerophosphoryl diester phosphodiesterase
MADVENKHLKKKIRLHYFLALILFAHCAFYLIYWFSVGNFWKDVDQFIVGWIGWQLPYTIIMMSLAGLIGLWSFGRFLGLGLALRKGKWHPAFVDWIFLLFWCLFLALFYATFIIILRENPSQRGVLLHLLNISRIGADGLLLLLAGVWFRRLILRFRCRMQTAEIRWPYTTGIILILISLVGLWLLPAVFPPNWAYQGDLPAKPALLAHRGASMLAPENTLAAIDLAAKYEAFGFETDIQISKDGSPFLMHDQTLARTTNVAEVFPERVDDRASSFTIDALKQLNAGLWFIQQDPFGAIDAGLVSQSQLGINQGQGIPLLSDALDRVEEARMVILFDMRDPPPDHPFADDFFDIVLKQCRESGLNEDVWFMVDWARIPTVREEASQLTRVIGVKSTELPSTQRLKDSGYDILNVDTGISAQAVQSYREEGLGVNVYTIDQPWLFSQFWLSGVTSVTTNNVHTFSQIDKPSLNIPYSRYLLYWGLFGIIVAIWLAGSQPKCEPQKPREMETPDLMDFAEDEQQANSFPAYDQDADIQEGRNQADDASDR